MGFEVSDTCPLRTKEHETVTITTTQSKGDLQMADRLTTLTTAAPQAPHRLSLTPRSTSELGSTLHVLPTFQSVFSLSTTGLAQVTASNK